MLETTADTAIQVLLIEPDLRCAKAIVHAFAATDHCRLRTVESLRDAETVVYRQQPDLVIADFRLPDSHGVQLLKDPGPTFNCPVIVLVEQDDVSAATRTLQSSVTEFVVKSDKSLNQLPDLANRVLREHRLILDAKLSARNQQRLTAILEATPDLICITDLDGFITYLNEAGRKMLGIPSDEDTSKTRLVEFIAPDSAKRLLADVIPEAIQQGVTQTETEFRSRADDLIFTSQVLIAHYSEQGSVEFFSTIARDMRHLRAAEKQAEYLAYYDTLTKLPNRNELIKRLDIELDHVKRLDRQGALLFIDLDNFKAINDSLGHRIGDLVLQQVATRLQSRVRSGDTVARLGGDEFVIILSLLSNNPVEAAGQARAVSEKIRKAVSRTIAIGEQELRVTASIGISMIDKTAQSADDLLKFADTAVYEAKNQGRNRLEFFDESMSELVVRRFQLENQLIQALRDRQFVLNYQPIFDAADNIVGAEALIRWLHPEKGQVPPAEFLGILESTGQIVEVGKWVIETALNQLSQWINAGVWHNDHKISINASPRQFQDSQFIDSVMANLERTRTPTTCLNIEVTESIVIDSLDTAIATMKALIAEQISFALDDFGTGYSSLSHLKNLPVSRIKIDKSFVRDICQDPSDEAMLSSILAMSEHLRLDVVAEGVETSEQLGLLKLKNCKYFQGYYFSKPLPAKAMTELLKRRAVNPR